MTTRFHDPEAVLTTFLREQLGIPAATKVDRSVKRFVRVLKVGGSRISRVADNPRLVIESYDPDEVAAQALAEDVRELLSMMHIGATGAVWVYRVVEVSGPQKLPDPNHDSIRYTQTVDVQLRGKRSTRSLA